MDETDASVDSPGDTVSMMMVEESGPRETVRVVTKQVVSDPALTASAAPLSVEEGRSGRGVDETTSVVVTELVQVLVWVATVSYTVTSADSLSGIAAMWPARLMAASAPRRIMSRILRDDLEIDFDQMTGCRELSVGLKWSRQVRRRIDASKSEMMQ